MDYHVYILYSDMLDKYYIGYTGDLPEERLYKHNANHAGFTGKAKDWTIVYTEKYSSKQEAMKRESEIKRWKARKKIEQLVNASRP